VPPPPVLNPVMPMMPGGAPDNDRMRDMMGDMMMGRRDWNRETLGLDRLVITDTAGTVLWNNSEYREDILSPKGDDRLPFATAAGTWVICTWAE
jgi:hypothetical protein